jgi:DNA-binding NarL/FixJ family response regulator
LILVGPGCALNDLFLADAEGSRISDAMNHLAERCQRFVRALHAPPPDLAPRIAELRASGKGVRQIARELQIAPSTVTRALARARRRAYGAE